MELIKKIILTLSLIPDKLYKEYFKKIITIILSIIIMECFILYIGELYLFITTQVIVFLLICMIIHEYKIITSSDLITLEGICTSTETPIVFTKKSKYNCIIVEVHGIRYKCNVPQQKITRYYPGCPVTIYTVNKNILPDINNMNLIYYPLYVLPYV